MSDMEGIEEEIYTPEYLRELREETEAERRKTQQTITKFLGKGPHSVEAYEPPGYYGRLLAWTLKCVSASSGFKIDSRLGQDYPTPFFADIQTDDEAHESCLISGLMLVEREGIRMAITIGGNGYIQIAAGEDYQQEVIKLVQEIKEYANKHNFYRGKRLSFGSRISFLNVGHRDWDSVILDPKIKNGIRLNTVGFLRNIARMEEFGIPPKRGIILAGDPGTGKTIICKALMSEARDITCIAATGFGEFSSKYISDLFSIAQDLCPSIIFLEDIDFIGQERNEYYHGSPPLLALLAEMDGLAQKTAIVTVATSNCFETLDKALSERPSRFDCVYRINRPDYQQRIELVKNISKKIPLSEDTEELVAIRTDGFTPAQVQAVIHTMAISGIDMKEEIMQFNASDVDSAITQINHKKNGRLMGFKPEHYQGTAVSIDWARQKE